MAHVARRVRLPLSCRVGVHTGTGFTVYTGKVLQSLGFTPAQASAFTGAMFFGVHTGTGFTDPPSASTPADSCHARLLEGHLSNRCVNGSDFWQLCVPREVDFWDPLSVRWRGVLRSWSQQLPGLTKLMLNRPTQSFAPVPSPEWRNY